MLTCREIVEFLRHYLDGELPAEERSRFEEHLAACPPCVDYLRSYKDTVRLGKGACAGDEAGCKDVPEALIRAILAARRAQS
jgi:anti-sigma factor RsiW